MCVGEPTIMEDYISSDGLIKTHRRTQEVRNKEIM